MSGNFWTMLVFGIGFGVLGLLVGYFARQYLTESKLKSAQAEAERIMAEAEAHKKDLLLQAKEEVLKLHEELAIRYRRGRAVVQHLEADPLRFRLDFVTVKPHPGIALGEADVQVTIRIIISESAGLGGYRMIIELPVERFIAPADTAPVHHDHRLRAAARDNQQILIAVHIKIRSVCVNAAFRAPAKSGPVRPVAEPA